MIKANDGQDPNLVHTYYVAANSGVHDQIAEDMPDAKKNPMLAQQNRLYSLIDTTKKNKSEIWTDTVGKSKERAANFASSPLAQSYTIEYFDMTSIVGAVDLSRGDKMSKTADPAMTKPIIVVSERFIPAGSLEEFKSGYLPAVDYLKGTVPGLKAICVTQDPQDETLLHDIQIFNDNEAFKQHADNTNPTLMQTLMGWMSKLDQSKPLYGSVYGGWDDFAVKATQGFGAKFDFRRSNKGFIRQDTAGREGTPLIFMFGRNLKPGTADAYMAAAEKLYAHEHATMPGVLAHTIS